MITIVKICEAFAKPNFWGKASFNRKSEISIWIVPGSDKDFRNDATEDYEQFTMRRGILVAERLSPEQTEKKIQEIRSKFSAARIEVKEEFFVND